MVAIWATQGRFASLPPCCLNSNVSFSDVLARVVVYTKLYFCTHYPVSYAWLPIFLLSLSCLNFYFPSPIRVAIFLHLYCFSLIRITSDNKIKFCGSSKVLLNVVLRMYT